MSLPEGMYKDVFDFHEKFDLLRHRDPGPLTDRKAYERVECMREELTEFIEAIEEGSLAKQADALVDLAYFVLGTAVMMGLPWDALWKEVQRANMSKVRGMTKRNHKVDVTKPPGWKPPRIMQVLVDHGFKPHAPPKPRDDEPGTNYVLDLEGDK